MRDEDEEGQEDKARNGRRKMKVRHRSPRRTWVLPPAATVGGDRRFPSDRTLIAFSSKPNSSCTRAGKWMRYGPRCAEGERTK